MQALPLFPLPIAACPRELVPLHIFEERYKEMIRFCRDQQEQGGAGEFILAFYGSSALAHVGTIVRLTNVLKEYEDGRLDVLVTGRRRCRIREVVSATSYRCALPDSMEDERADWNETLATKAYNLHRALIQVVTGEAPGDQLYAGVTQLSFPLAATIHLGHDEKQRLLEMTSEDERLQFLIATMNEFSRMLEQVQVAARAIRNHWELHKIHGTGNQPR